MRLISPSNNRGFTLLELLVVIFIIGLLGATASLSLGSFAEPPEETLGKQLYHQLQQAREQAVFKNRDIGIQVDRQGYSFWQWQQGQWQSLSTRGLEAGSWPDSVKTGLQIEQQPVDLQRVQRPQIQIYSDGQILPFELHLSGLTSQVSLAAAFHSDLNLNQQPLGES